MTDTSLKRKKDPNKKKKKKVVSKPAPTKPKKKTVPVKPKKKAVETKKPKEKSKKIKETEKPKKTKKTKKKEIVNWTETIQQWKKGKNLPKIKTSVYWETSRAHSLGSSEFIQKTKSSLKKLPMNMKADSSPFKKQLSGATQPVKFYNLDKSAILVSPPNTGKNFSHIGTFYKNSTLQERKDLWKKVAKVVEKKLKKGSDVFVSTHGTNVAWLHVRVECTPKYYVTDLKKT